MTVNTINANEPAAEQHFLIERIYLKDLSFEAPHTPQLFQKEWQPQLQMDIQSHSQLLENDVYEVVLVLTVSVGTQEQTGFLVEVKQAGIFSVKGFPAEQLQHLLGSYCPNVLYPYAREVVSDVVTKGTFPQLILSPVNFDALYAQHLEKQEGIQNNAGIEKTANEGTGSATA